MSGRAQREAERQEREAEAVDDEMTDLRAENARLVVELAAATAERDRLQRACDEGLPREYIECPSCGKQHLEWFRHDAPGIDGRKRPHHTHRCYHCAHVWDSGRWSFGANVPKPVDATTALRARVAELEAIIAGRTTPPTDVEIAAHDGEWLCSFEGRPCIAEHASDARYLLKCGAQKWIPLRRGVPCAWPEVSHG